MSYTRANLRVIAPTDLSHGNSEWQYHGVDPDSVVGTGAFFSNALDAGMKAGDVLLARCTADGSVGWHSVMLVSPSGAALSRNNAGWATADLPAGSTNDLDPRGASPPPMSSFDHLTVLSTVGAATVTGLLAGVDMQTLIVNADSANTSSVTFTGKDLGSAAANRFSAAFTLAAGASIALVYYVATRLWTPFTLQ
jgi:hypothetical protein